MVLRIGRGSPEVPELGGVREPIVGGKTVATEGEEVGTKGWTPSTRARSTTGTGGSTPLTPAELRASRAGATTVTAHTTGPADPTNATHFQTFDGFNREAPTNIMSGWVDWFTLPAVFGKAFEAASTNQTKLATAQHAGDGTTLLAHSAAGNPALDAYHGVIGTDGPLGPNGPLGDAGKPSTNISGRPAWNEGRDDASGPFSQYGVFSSRGPGLVNPTNTAIASDLRVGGSMAVEGFAGPSSAWGATGPLSEVGAHGFHRDPATGDFLDAKGQVRRTVVAQYDDKTAATLHLDERYTEARAKQLGKLGQQDTSFQVDGSIKGKKELDTFKFEVDRPQVVTLNIVPTDKNAAAGHQNFDLVLFDRNGKPAVVTKSQSEGSWAQVLLEPGEYAVGVMRTTQSAAQASASDTSGYRLQVTGTQNQNFVYNLTGADGKKLVSPSAGRAPSRISADLDRLTADDVRVRSP